MKAAPARLTDLIRPPTIAALISGILAQDALGGAAEGWEGQREPPAPHGGHLGPPSPLFPPSHGDPAVSHRHVCPRCGERRECPDGGRRCSQVWQGHLCPPPGASAAPVAPPI